MIFGHAFALISRFMFLVHDDQPQIGTGGKKGGPRADHHIQLSPPGTFKLVVLLARGKRRIHHGNTVAEKLVKPHQRLKGERNFRNQQNHRFPSFYHFPCQAKIDLCLSAAGNSMNQIGLSYLFIIVLQYLFYDQRLFGTKR